MKIPDDWDIWHSSSHWSSHETVGRYLQTVLLPWVTNRKKALDLQENQQCLLIMDEYRAHRTTDVLTALQDLGFKVQFIPGNCSSSLQPLDLTVNSLLKSRLKDQFMDWYAGQVSEAMKHHPDHIYAAVAAVRPDLRLSVIKPLHAGWVIDAFAAVQGRPEVIKCGWQQAGITTALSTGKSSPDQTQTPLLVTASPGQEHQQYKTTLTLWKNASVWEHFASASISQSWLDGRNGSSACTVKSLCLTKACLLGQLSTLCMGREPSEKIKDTFLSAIRLGNKMYDKKQAEGVKLGLLSITQACLLWPEMGVHTKPGYDFGFLSNQDAAKKLDMFLVQAIPGDDLVPCVYVKTPYTVTVVAGRGQLSIFDSHSHGTKGALIAILGSTASLRDLVE